MANSDCPDAEAFLLTPEQLEQELNALRTNASPQLMAARWHAEALDRLELHIAALEAKLCPSVCVHPQRESPHRMKRFALSILLIVLTAIGLAACGSVDPSSTESTASVQQPLIVPLVEHVRPDALQMVAPKGLLSEDPARPTPLLTQTTVVIPPTGKTCAGSFVGGLGIYGSTTHQAILCLSSAQFNAINAGLALEPTHTTDVNLSYDDSGAALNKVVTAFSFPVH